MDWHGEASLGRAGRGEVRPGLAGQGKAWRFRRFLDKNRHHQKTRRRSMEKVNYNETQISNDGEYSISPPYSVECELTGACPILFHRWSCEDVEQKAAAAKNSKTKKTDNTDVYVYRNKEGEICLLTEAVRQATITAAKYQQDPRSPRKSACDIFKAGVIPLHELASLGATEPDFLDKRRVCIQRAGVTRTRPAMLEGWKANVIFQTLIPEYISPGLLHRVLVDAGRLVGVGDFRPSYGRFQVTRFEVLG
jgi:hypothetical protein